MTAVFMACALLTSQTFAVTLPFNGIDFSDDASEIINFNDDEVYAEFSEIDALTAMITEKDVTFEEIAMTGTDLSSVSASSALPVSSEGDTAPPLGIPAFLWGCVFGILGLALVYFMTGQDGEQTKKALWGCIVGTLVWGVGGLAFQ